MKEIITIAGLIMVLSACKKDQPKEANYFAFGSAYGECQGNCANFFLIKDINLYPDDMNYFSTPLKFKNDALSAEKYNLVKHLLDSFPSYLKNNPNQTFGCPDCYDQGRIYIKL